MKVIVYRDDNKRSQFLSDKVAQGLRRHNVCVDVKPAQEYVGTPHADVAIFYGLRKKLRQIFIDYRDSNRKAILIDLGYLGRENNGKLTEYHKVVVNSYHPTEYFQKIKHDDIRAKRLSYAVDCASNDDGHILLAGMSAKSAWAYFMEKEQYERLAINKIKKYTNKKIVYRPKPSWVGAKPIEGCLYSGPKQPLNDVLSGAYAVVTHHSNVAIDAILKGIPCFVEADNPAIVLGTSDVSMIEKPRYPDEKEVLQFINDISYTQYTPDEMASGLMWQYLNDEGLL